MSDSSSSSTPNPWPDLAGRLEGGAHILPVRVYHEDTDFTGIVYHGSYVRFMERARSDMLRLMAISQRDLAEEGEAAGFAVRRMSIDFRKPARIEDVLEVRTVATELKGASITLYQAIWRDGVYLVGALVQVALLSVDGRPLRLGGSLRSRLAAAPRSLTDEAARLRNWRS